MSVGEQSFTADLVSTNIQVYEVQKIINRFVILNRLFIGANIYQHLVERNDAIKVNVTMRGSWY